METYRAAGNGTCLGLYLLRLLWLKLNDIRYLILRILCTRPYQKCQSSKVWPLRMLKHLLVSSFWCCFLCSVIPEIHREPLSTMTEQISLFTAVVQKYLFVPCNNWQRYKILVSGFDSTRQSESLSEAQIFGWFWVYYHFWATKKIVRTHSLTFSAQFSDVRSANL